LLFHITKKDMQAYYNERQHPRSRCSVRSPFAGCSADAAAAVQGCLPEWPDQPRGRGGARGCLRPRLRPSPPHLPAVLLMR